jgi:hypothetical protein
MKRMMRWSFVGWMLAIACTLAAPAFAANNVDDEIQQLKTKLATLEQQQMDLKKDAVAAEAALPTFSYRPGNGLNIEAADKSWSIRFSMESHIRMLFEAGRDQVGRTNGEIMLRRFRPSFFYCINNCLWEIETSIDLDGFGTGNAKNSTGGLSSILQRGVVHFHAENLNPFLPTITAGGDLSTTGAAAISRQGSSATGAQREYDIMSRQIGPNTGRAGNGIDFKWDDRSLSGIGIPGRISRFQISSATISEGDDNLSSFKDVRSYDGYLGVQPFSQLKNKWIRGMLFEFGGWFCNNDPRGDNGCDRFRLRDHGDEAPQTLFDTGSGSIGRGLFTYLSPGFTWEIGPYRLRVMGGFAQAHDEGGTPGKKRAHNFLIGHDLYIWSPKGFLTGSPTTPGSILLGTHFERNDASCETSARCSSINGGQFHRETVLLREWDIWYFIAPRMSIGVNVLWYDASNLRTGRGQAGDNLEIFPKSCRTGTACRGRGGDWTDASLTWRYDF